MTKFSAEYLIQITMICKSWLIYCNYTKTNLCSCVSWLLATPGQRRAARRGETTPSNSKDSRNDVADEPHFRTVLTGPHKRPSVRALNPLPPPSGRAPTSVTGNPKVRYRHGREKTYSTSISSPPTGRGHKSDRHSDDRHSRCRRGVPPAARIDTVVRGVWRAGVPCAPTTPDTLPPMSLLPLRRRAPLKGNLLGRSRFHNTGRTGRLVTSRRSLGIPFPFRLPSPALTL